MTVDPNPEGGPIHTALDRDSPHPASAVTVPPLVQTLPYVAWVLLTTLSFGSFALVFVTRQLSDATTGYVRFMAFSAALLAVLATAVAGALVGSGPPARQPPAPHRGVGAGRLFFSPLARVYSFLVCRPPPPPGGGG